MDVLFINSNDKLFLSHECNGTMLLASKLLQAGIHADILRYAQIPSYQKDYKAFIQDITQRILSLHAKCVSFYVIWPNCHIQLRIAAEVKKANNNIHIVFGGPHASITAAHIMKEMSFVDFICTGEGENTVVPFFRALLDEQNETFRTIPGLFYRYGDAWQSTKGTPALCDLNTLPFWDKQLLQFSDSAKRLAARDYFMPIDAGRGCPFSCTFCCSSRFWQRNYRMKSPERILQDIRYFYDNFGIKSFWFSHDAFTVNKAFVATICDKLKELDTDIQWKCTSRVDCIDEDLILKMKDAGLRRIELGIETGSPRMQRIINKKLDLTNARSIVSFLLKQGIHVSLFFMYGFPEETEEDLQQTLNLFFDFVDMGVDYASMSFCKFNPSTAITNEHFDSLVFDPKISVLSRKVFGYEEELSVIRSSKAIFPFYYHLPTPLRDNFQQLTFLCYLYRLFPTFAKHLRSLFHGDDLRFYRTFYNSNRSIFDKGMAFAMEQVGSAPQHYFENILAELEDTHLPQLRGLLAMETDLRQLSRMPNGTVMKKNYDFSYFDLLTHQPLENFSQGQSQLLLAKQNESIQKKVLNVT